MCCRHGHCRFLNRATASDANRCINLREEFPRVAHALHERQVHRRARCANTRFGGRSERQFHPGPHKAQDAENRAGPRIRELPEQSGER